jgi:hypothetical protein
MGRQTRYRPQAKMALLGWRRRTPLTGPRPRITFLLVAIACAGLLAGCGGGAKHSPKAEAELGAETRVAGEEAVEATAAKRRVAHLKQAEAAEEAALKKKVEEARRAQAQASTTAPKKTNKHSTSTAKNTKSAHKQRPSQPTKTTKPKSAGGESPSEKTAREQFAKEEAQEQAAYQKREREEAAGH